MIGIALGVIRFFTGSGIGAGLGKEIINAAVPMGVTGLLCGLGFGSLLAFAERRKTILDLSLARVAIWGVLGSAVIPVLTLSFELIVITAPLGALFASASVVIARKAERRESDEPMLSNHPMQGALDGKL